MALAALALNLGCGDDDDDDDDDNDDDAFPYLEDGRYPWGYLLSGDEATWERLADFNIVVFDVPAEDNPELMDILGEAGTRVWSYVNLGSLENWRDTWDELKDLCRQNYEGWEDECWVDVTDERWQDHFVDEVCAQAMDMGADGFYIDNTDVYDIFPEDEVRDALLDIYQRLRNTFPDAEIVVQNGGALLTDPEVGDQVLDLVDATSWEDVSFMPDFDAEDEGLHTYIPRDPQEHQEILAILDELSDSVDVYTVDYTESADDMLQAVKIALDHEFTPFVGDKELARLDFYPPL